MPVAEHNGSLKEAFIQSYNVKGTLEHLEFFAGTFFQADDFSMTYTKESSGRSLSSGNLRFTTQFDPAANGVLPRQYSHEVEIKNDGAASLKHYNQGTEVSSHPVDIFRLAPQVAASRILVSLVQTHPEQYMVLSRLHELQRARAAGEMPHFAKQ